MTNNKQRILVGEKGFTLIELMIVIAIIGILAAVAIPNFIAYRDKAFCSAAETDARSIAATLADYFAIPSHTDLAVPINLGIVNQGFPGGNYVVSVNGNIALSSNPNFSPLSGENLARIDGDIDSLTITITEASERCPLDYRTAQDGWSTTVPPIDITFTKSMR